MSQDPRSWFEAYKQGGNRDAMLAAELLAFEQRTVHTTLKILGLLKRRWELMGIVQDATGQRELRLWAFNQLFSTFPLVLGCNKLARLELPYAHKETKQKVTPDTYQIHRDKASAVPSMLLRFSHVPFTIAFKQFHATVAKEAQSRTVGLVVPRKGIVPGGLIVHNDGSEALWVSGTRIVHKFPGAKDRRLYVEPFRVLLAAVVASGWRPE